MTHSQFSRRDALKSGLAATALASLPGVAGGEEALPARKGRIQQAVCRWCYKDIPLDQLCAFGAQIGLKGIDLLQPDEYEVPRRYGLICTMAYAGGGTIPDALNRTENHAAIESNLRANIPLAVKAGIPAVITFSGNRRGMTDDEGARNTIAGLNRVKKIAEDNGVVICMELLNSKVNPARISRSAQRGAAARVVALDERQHLHRGHQARSRMDASRGRGRRHHLRRRHQYAAGGAASPHLYDAGVEAGIQLRRHHRAQCMNMEVAIASSPGWSETGGPWVPASQGMKKMVWSGDAR
jgi:hypothetical protein